MFRMMKAAKPIYILAALGLALTGCTEMAELTGQQTTRPACADRVIDRAFILYGEAKSGFALFLEEHNDNRLFQAYYAAWDSRSTARAVRRCWDRRRSHFNAMQNLEEMNALLAHIIRINMPDADPGYMVAIYREQYERIMNPLP